MKPREALALPFPRSVMIQTTSRCNSACVICPQPLIRREMPQGEMDDATFAALLAEIAKFPPLERLMLYLMNEPLLDAQIVERLRAARAALPTTEIYLLSNGAALTDELTDALLDAGLTWIGFSLHAARPDTYQAITGRTDFLRVREQVTRCVRKALTKLGPDGAAIKALRVRPHVSDEEWAELAEYWRGVGLRRIELEQGYISRAGNVEVFGRAPVNHAAVFGCGTVWAYEMAHVLFDGAVVPCCMDYRRRAVWGNVRDAGLLAVWRGEARRRFLERMDGRPLPSDDLCAHCEDAIVAPAHLERLSALERRVDALGERLRALTAGLRKHEPIPQRADGESGSSTSGIAIEAPALALALCPVWSPDMPPYALASLAASAAAAGLAPAVFDFNVAAYRRSAPELQRFWEEDSFRHWTDLAEWERLRPHLDAEIQRCADELLAAGPRLIGFSVYSPNRRFTIEVCQRLKAADPSRVIIIGGRGVHTAPERLLFPPGSVDWFVLGEGEEALVALARALNAGGDPRALPFVDWFAGAQLRGSPQPARVARPETLPPPDYAFFDRRAYRTNELPILGSRGCIGHCAFCNDHEVMGPLRQRPGRQIAEEMLALQRRHGANSFRFNDQLVNGDLAALEELCDALIAADAKLEWIALAAPRGDMPDRLAAKLKAAGCKTLNLGVEAGADALLRRMAKGYRVADLERALRQIRLAGVNTMINFVVGFPGETEADFAETLAFVRRSREFICGVNSVNTCILLLGSPLERNQEKLGVTVPPGAPPDTGWTLGENTPAARLDRAQRLLAVLDELGIPARVSNLHEKRAALPGAAREGWPPVERRDVDALLVMAPVWGVDAPPLGIAYVQSYLQAHGVTAQCLDLNVKFYRRACESLSAFVASFAALDLDQQCAGRGLDPALWKMEAYKQWTEPEPFAELWAAFGELVEHYAAELAAHPARIVGFSVNTGNYRFTRAFAQRLKELRPERPIVFGGPGVTNSFDIADLTTAEVDWLVLGEGEKAALALFRGLLAGDVPAIHGVRRVGEPIAYEARAWPILENLEEVDWPRLEDFALAEYAAPAVPILGSRGCIRRCAFCNDHHLYQKFRRRPAEAIVAEMLWHAERGRKRFSFHDVLINGDVPALERLCDLLIESGHRLHWGGQGVIRPEMTPEVFAKLARAGCESFVFGVESFSDRVLKLMNKPYTRAAAQAVLTACHNAGLQTNINLIVGYPGEGEAEFRETYDFLRDHGDVIDHVASITPCLINLGSRLFDRREAIGIRFPPHEGSIKWWTDDGNTFEERRRRLLAITTLLARREHDVFTLNLYDEKRGELPTVALDEPPTPSASPPGERPDVLLALPPPWGVEFPPLGLGALAAAWREAGLRVAVRDLNIEWRHECGEHLRSYWAPANLKFWAAEGRLAEIVAFLTPAIKAFLADVQRLQPRAVGFSTNESNLPLAAQLAQRIKKIAPATTVIFGGPGVHWEADRARLGSAADFCVVGEGERALPRLLSALAAGDGAAAVPGVAQLTDGAWVAGPPPEAIRELDALPAPDFADLPLHLYLTNQFPLQFGRGCVNRCAFCNDHLIAPGYRALSPERLLAIAQGHKRRHGVHAFAFNDLLVNADLARLRRFCELTAEAKERFAWTGQCLVRPEMSAEDFQLLRRAGCVSLTFGVESLSDDVLRLMGKRFDAAAAAAALQRAKDAGIETLVNLIVGFPGETEASFAATCDFVRRHARLIDRVGALSTCIVVANCRLEREPEAFDIELPRPEHWRQWRSRDGANTYEARVDRLRRLARVLAEAGVPGGAVNLYAEALNQP